MAKVWRNNEGREFPAGDGTGWAFLEGKLDIPPDAMRDLGYELVQGESEKPTQPEGIICELRVGIAKDGPYLTLQNHDAGEVCLDIWHYQAEQIWMPMCEQLGIPYVDPDWDALESEMADGEFSL